MTLKPYPTTGNEPALTTALREWADSGYPTSGRIWDELRSQAELDYADRELIADNEHEARRERGWPLEAAE